MDLTEARSGFYCDMSALSPVERVRQGERLRAVRALIQQTRERPDGFSVRLPADPQAFLAAADRLSLERRCCPFLDVRLEWTRNDEVWLSLTGPERCQTLHHARDRGRSGRRRGLVSRDPH